ncbi:MAG: hypothetical protein LBT63_03075 [Holosporaceae bacterium]|jgi:hypothetical protein|nr:hypothetical protein [Holosporaceae bacterium]
MKKKALFLGAMLCCGTPFFDLEAYLNEPIRERPGGSKPDTDGAYGFSETSGHRSNAGAPKGFGGRQPYGAWSGYGAQNRFGGNHPSGQKGASQGYGQYGRHGGEFTQNRPADRYQSNRIDADSDLYEALFDSNDSGTFVRQIASEVKQLIQNGRSPENVAKEIFVLLLAWTVKTSGLKGNEKTTAAELFDRVFGNLASQIPTMAALLTKQRNLVFKVFKKPEHPTENQSRPIKNILGKEAVRSGEATPAAIGGFVAELRMAIEDNDFIEKDIQVAKDLEQTIVEWAYGNEGSRFPFKYASPEKEEIIAGITEKLAARLNKSSYPNVLDTLQSILENAKYIGERARVLGTK